MYQLPIDSPFSGNSTNQINHQEIQWQINQSGTLFGGSNTANINLYSNRRLISVDIKETTIEIAYRETPNFTYTVYMPNGFTQPDRIWKEVYGLKDGKMTLLRVINGKHTPAYNVVETFEFDDEKE